MAKTVIEAFDSFLKDTVNLDPAQTKKAKGSLDWLVGPCIDKPVFLISFMNHEQAPQGARIKPHKKGGIFTAFPILHLN